MFLSNIRITSLHTSGNFFAPYFHLLCTFFLFHYFFQDIVRPKMMNRCFPKCIDIAEDEASDDNHGILHFIEIPGIKIQ